MCWIIIGLTSVLIDMTPSLLFSPSFPFLSITSPRIEELKPVPSPLLLPGADVMILAVFIFLFIHCYTIVYFLKYVFIASREKERERYILLETSNMRENHRLAASCMPSTGDWTGNPNMCPDQEANQWPPGSWVCLNHWTTLAELHHRLLSIYYVKVLWLWLGNTFSPYFTI